MDYKKIYDDLMDKGRSRIKSVGCYYELHHILPRSMGGTDDDENLVWLTAREHFVAHALLVKFVSGADKSKMVFAFFAMCNQKAKGQEHRYTPKSKIYDMGKSLHRMPCLNCIKVNLYQKSIKNR